MKRVLRFSWRSLVVEALFQGARRCITKAAFFQMARRYTAGNAACDDSFSVEIPISGGGEGNRFLPWRS